MSSPLSIVFIIWLFQLFEHLLVPSLYIESYCMFRLRHGVEVGMGFTQLRAEGLRIA